MVFRPFKWVTLEMMKAFIDADKLGKRQILLKNSTSSAQAAMYVDDLCGEETDCKGVVNEQVATKIGDKSKQIPTLHQSTFA